MRRFAMLAATVSLGCAPHLASNVGPVPIAPTVVVVGRAFPGYTPRELVVVVRDVDEPARPIQEAIVMLAPRGASWESPTARRAISRPDGIATVELVGRNEVSIRVRRVGYALAETALNLRPGCPQTLELYIARDPTRLDNVPFTPTPPRATFTTCAPPA